MISVELDLLIVGGGIAGLWSLNRARQAGYSCLLLENRHLGGGQTICSQGIIHGGTKYSLSGSLSQATQSISAMPERWFKALQGEGEIDLRDTRILSEKHYLWSVNSLSSKVTTFFASKAMRNKTSKVKPADYPPAFQSEAFQGRLYSLNERVVDVPSLIRNLSRQHMDAILKLDILKDGKLEFDEHGNVKAVLFPQHKLRLCPQKLLFTCGEAYAKFKDRLPANNVDMQTRPLHMLVFRQKNAPALFAHAIGASSQPLLTVTTHPHSSGDTIWHIGGLIAEDGVKLEAEALIEKAKQQLRDSLPWISLTGGQWSTYRINRAEPKTKGQLRPDASFLSEKHNMMIAWPTKLALAPQLSDHVLEVLTRLGERKQSELSLLESIERPDIATPVWEQN